MSTPDVDDRDTVVSPGTMHQRLWIMATVMCAPFLLFHPAAAGESASAGDSAVGLAFHASGQEYNFNTGALTGTLRPDGKSIGFASLVDSRSGKKIALGHGVFSHYRLLDAKTRYGAGAWDWPSTSRATTEGTASVRWAMDDDHPFEMTAVYRWHKANTLDLTTRVTPRIDMRNLEVFLASYLDGFASSRVYVAGCAETGGKAGFVAATKTDGDWHMFPRDDDAIRLIGDGRWERPPHPVAWRVRPKLAAPLAMRRDEASGLVVLVMAPSTDCFAVGTPYGEEGHRSLYLSLMGRDIRAGESATARARFVIGRDISDAQAVALYEEYISEVPR